MANALSDKGRPLIGAYWRVANYLSVRSTSVTIRCSTAGLEVRGSHETAGVYWPSWIGGDLAARGTGAGVQGQGLSHRHFEPLEATERQVFRDGTRDLGYVEGKSVLYDVRYAEGNADQLPRAAGREHYRLSQRRSPRSL
jgi:hypothetical protein